MSVGDSPPAMATPLATRSTSTSVVATSIVAGAFAAFASLFGKLTTSHLIATASLLPAAVFPVDPSTLEPLIRITSFLLIFLCNAIMWGLFTRALNMSGSSTPVVILNATANFMITALIGMLGFGETVGAGWWLGAALIISGTVLVGSSAVGASGSTGDGEDVKAQLVASAVE